MYALIQDVKYAVRMLFKHKSFTFFALVTLAAGIGVNTAMFTLVTTITSMHHRFTDPDSLACLWSKNETNQRWFVSVPDFLDWREQTNSFTEMAMYGRGVYTLSDEGEPRRVDSLLATSELLPMLGLEPPLGRTFTAAECAPEGDRVALLTDHLWREQFDASPNVLGRTVTVNDEPYTIIGVLGPKFVSETLWYGVDMVTPIRIDAASAKRDRCSYRVIARLKPGVDAAQAQAELEGVAARLAAAYPETNEKRGALATPLADEFMSSSDRVFIPIVLGAVGLVLLIACANLANLLLAKATTRDREFAVRAALGAGRGRIIRQLLTESVLLALLGGACGLIVGDWTLNAFIAFSEGIPLTPDELALKPGVLVYGLLISLIAAAAFGLAPALLASRVSVNESLKEGATASSAAGSRNRMRNALIVGQLAIALPMLISCGLTLRHVHESRSINFGYDSAGLMTLEVDLPTHRYKTEQQRADYYREALEKIRALPEVANAGAANTLPVFNMGPAIGGIAVETGNEPLHRIPEYLDYSIVTPEFFETMGMPLASGRGFTELDQADSLPTAVISHRMAETYWPNEDPVGKHLTLDPDASPVEWVTIVGVTANAGRSFYGGPPRPAVHLPHAQHARSDMKLAVRTRGEPRDAIATLRGALRELDAGVPIHDFLTVDQIVHRHLRDDRLAARFLMLLAGLALALASFGLYGVIAYAVAQRTHEIGVRVALGADRRDITRLVLRRSMKLTLIGLAVGLALAVPVGLILQAQLYGVSGVDPFTYAGVSVVLLLVALAASYMPARRATKIDPMTALRCE